MYVCTLFRIYSYVVEVVVRGSTCCTSGWWSWNEMNIVNLHWLMYICNNEITWDNSQMSFTTKGDNYSWLRDSNTWEDQSRVLNALYTYELGIVSMEKFIDTLSLSHSLLAGETVNCCQYVEDLIAIEDSRYRNISYLYWSLSLLFHISRNSKNYNLYQPDMAESDRLLIVKN